MVGKDPVAAVYAQALAGAGARDLPDIEAAFEALVTVWRGSPEFRAFLAAPTLSVDIKKKALREALAGAPAVFLYFLSLVADKGRLGSLPAIQEAFRDLRDRQAGRVRVQAATAVALSPEQAAGLKAALGQKFGGEAVVESQVKPELIGGLRLQVGDWVADGTLRRRLRDLSRSVIETGAPQGAWNL